MTSTKANQVIGANLRQHRKAAKISQEKMGKVLGVHQTALCRIELGLQTLTAYQAYRASEVLNLRVDCLLEGVRR